MTRQATFKLPAMSVGNLIQLRGQIDQHLAQRRKNLEQQLSELSSYITKASNSAGKQSPTKRNKVKAKYRGPKGETWAGRGLHPRWLAALITQGHKLQEYAIGARRGKAAALRTKTATKKSNRKRAKAKPKK
jgi:DNA-binding protein H-NS